MCVEIFFKFKGEKKLRVPEEELQNGNGRVHRKQQCTW